MLLRCHLGRDEEFESPAEDGRWAQKKFFKGASTSLGDVDCAAVLIENHRALSV